MGTCVGVRGHPVVAPDPYTTVAIPWKPRLDSAWDHDSFCDRGIIILLRKDSSRGSTRRRRLSSEEEVANADAERRRERWREETKLRTTIPRLPG